MNAQKSPFPASKKNESTNVLFGAPRSGPNRAKLDQLGILRASQGKGFASEECVVVSRGLEPLTFSLGTIAELVRASEIPTRLRANARELGVQRLCTKPAQYRASEKTGLSENRMRGDSVREVQRSSPKQRHDSPKRTDQQPWRTGAAWVGGGGSGIRIRVTGLADHKIISLFQ
jgi:hypothetical protein